MNFSHDFLAIFNLLHRRNRDSIYAISISIFVFDQDVQTKKYIINEFSILNMIKKVFILFYSVSNQNTITFLPIIRKYTILDYSLLACI